MEKILQVLFYPNPTLLQKSEKIVSFDKNLKKFSQDMLKTVEHYKGIGLAAPQVGVLKRTRRYVEDEILRSLFV